LTVVFACGASVVQLWFQKALQALIGVGMVYAKNFHDLLKVRS